MSEFFILSFLISFVQNDSTSFGEDPKVMRECLQSRSIIQQLLNNSSELEKCFILLKELDAEQELIDRVLIMKTKVSENVKCFMQSNGEFDSKINKQIRNQSEGNFKDISDSDQILIQKDQNDLQNVQRTYEEILSINRDLQELNDLMVHFGELVHVNNLKLIFLKYLLINSIKTSRNKKKLSITSKKTLRQHLKTFRKGPKF